jgi:hypothetical protein
MGSEGEETVYRIFTLPYWILLIIYAAVCIIIAGIGMGVPILNILSGFIIGWFAAIRADRLYKDLRQKMSRTLVYSLICAAITMVVMLAIWARTIPLLFDPLADLENFGHPMILFDPRISFIGWLVLMIIISPFLQLLTSIFSAFLALRPRRHL